MASTGGQYGSAYGRRANMNREYGNISDELHFADQGSDTTYR